jgi:hypothetical protein
MMKHSHPIEWAWFLITLVGFVVSVSSMRAAERSWDMLSQPVDGQPPRIDANGATQAINMAIRWSSRISVMGHTFIVAAAVSALLLAPPPPDYSVLPQSLTNIVWWIAVSLTFTGQSVFGWFMRQRLNSGVYDRPHNQRGTIEVSTADDGDHEHGRSDHRSDPAR